MIRGMVLDKVREVPGRVEVPGMEDEEGHHIIVSLAVFPMVLRSSRPILVQEEHRLVEELSD
jgi:hypothetical protein